MLRYKGVGSEGGPCRKLPVRAVHPSVSSSRTMARLLSKVLRATYDSYILSGSCRAGTEALCQPPSNVLAAFGSASRSLCSAPALETKAPAPTVATVKKQFAASIAQITRGDPSVAFSVLPAIVDTVLDCIPKAVHAVAVTSINEEAICYSAAGEYYGANMKGALPQADLVFSVDAAQVYPVMLFLSQHAQLQFNTLVEMTAVDYPERTEKRFEVTYVLWSPTVNARIIVKAMVDELTPVESVVPIYANANWLERETWDMFGVFFKNHPDLRRLLTDYGFSHHPLRKDFPVQGYTEVFYSESRKAVTTRSVQLAQTQRVVTGQS